jgi:UDP-N-acetylenolpyruvoylglucosamine reductase
MRTIYFDLDGVLVDLHPTYVKLMGESMLTQQKFEESVFDHQIFRVAPPTAEFELFMDAMMRHRDKVQFCVLGSLGSTWKNQERQNEILAQKRDWLKQYNVHIPAYFVSDKTYKAKYASPVSSLIDDTQFNVDTFIQAGGTGIFHKHGQPDDALAFIENVVAESADPKTYFIF